MKNKNKLRIFLPAVIMAGFFIFTLAPKAFASLQITEIMYDLSGTDTGREWIEIYNPDATSVDMTKIKLREASTNHGIATSTGGNILGASSYAVIADVPANFLADNPSFSGILFDSTFSLSNTGEPLELRDASSTTLDLITYDSLVGANGDGNSLQKINGNWSASIPTPGLENIFVDTSTSTATTTDPGSGGTSTTTSTSTSDTSDTSNVVTHTVTRTVYISTHSGEEDLSDFQDKSSFVTSAGRQRIAYVGAPVALKANYKIPKSMQSNSLTFTWSFGDGLSASGQEVTHSYKYPGEYNVILNGESGNEHSISRTIIKVLSTNIFIVILADGGIEISNNGNTEINLGSWELRDANNKFIFPEDTIIGVGNKITLSSIDTKISGSNNRISLNNPSGGEVFVLDTEKAAEASSTITLEQAQALSDNYKKSLALHFRQNAISNIPFQNSSYSENLQNDISSSSLDDIPMTASVLEASSSIKTGFWKRLFSLPVSGAKAVFHLFYRF